MKKNYIIPLAILSASVLLTQSCEKEIIPKENLEISKIPYEYFENEVKKEITITDNFKENTVFITVYSDKLSTLETFLSSNEFQLITELDDGQDEIFNTKSQLEEDTKKDLSNYKIENEPEVFIEITMVNLKPGVEKYFIDLVPKKKSTQYIPGGILGWSTYDGFIGTVHKGWGSEYLVQWTYKDKWYSSLKYFEISGVNAWFIYPSGVYYGWLDKDWYKINMIIRPDYYQTAVNYRVAFASNDMRGQTCSFVGSYDGSSCYIGTAPTGTTAFFYTYSNGDTYCMYSPVNGNQCPLTGSVFDGANCQYIQIDLDEVVPFLSNNKWHVKSDIIEPLI